MIRFPLASANNPAPRGAGKAWVESKGAAERTEETEPDANDGDVLPGQTLRHPDGRSTILCRGYNDNLVVWEYCIHCHKVLLSTSMDKHLKISESRKDESSRCKNHPYYVNSTAAPSAIKGQFLSLELILVHMLPIRSH